MLGMNPPTFKNGGVFLVNRVQVTFVTASRVHSPPT